MKQVEHFADSTDWPHDPQNPRMAMRIQPNSATQAIRATQTVNAIKAMMAIKAMVAIRAMMAIRAMPSDVSD